MKLSLLTQQDKIKLAAELDGFTATYNKDNGLWHWLNKSNGHVKLFGNGISEEHLIAITNYHISYDAIIPLIQKQERGIQWEIHNYLCARAHNVPVWANSTPSQLLDALLVATGKAEL